MGDKYPDCYSQMVAAGRADKQKLVHVELLSASEVATRAASAIAIEDASSKSRSSHSDSKSRNPDPNRVSGASDLNSCVCVVTLNDPPTLNALSITLMVQLRDAVEALCANPDVKCIVLTGAEPAFCSGGQLDLIATTADKVHANINNNSTLGSGTAEPWRFIRLQFGSMVRMIANANQLFVAAVNGSAAGVGMAFALACDCIIASKERAVFVPAFGRLGLLPEVGTSWAITRKLGYQGALNMFLDGKHVKGEQLLQLGLVQQLVTHKQLLPAAFAWCHRMLSLPPHTIEMTKTLLRAVSDLPFEPALRMEELAEANVFSTRALPAAARAIKAKL